MRFRLRRAGQYVLCEFEDFTEAAQMKAWAEGGFAVEAFYVMGNKSSYRASFVLQKE